MAKSKSTVVMEGPWLAKVLAWLMVDPMRMGAMVLSLVGGIAALSAGCQARDTRKLLETEKKAHAESEQELTKRAREQLDEQDKMQRTETRATRAESSLQQERKESTRLASQLSQARDRRKVKEPVLTPDGRLLLDGNGEVVYREVDETKSSSNSSSQAEGQATDSSSAHTVVVEQLQRELSEEKSRTEDWQMVADLRKRTLTETSEKLTKLEQEKAARPHAYLGGGYDFLGLGPEAQRWRVGGGAILYPFRVGVEAAPGGVLSRPKLPDGQDMPVLQALEPRLKADWDFY